MSLNNPHNAFGKPPNLVHLLTETFSQTTGTSVLTTERPTNCRRRCFLAAAVHHVNICLSHPKKPSPIVQEFCGPRRRHLWLPVENLLFWSVGAGSRIYVTNNIPVRRRVPMTCHTPHPSCRWRWAVESPTGRCGLSTVCFTALSNACGNVG